MKKLDDVVRVYNKLVEEFRDEQLEDEKARRSQDYGDYMDERHRQFECLRSAATVTGHLFQGLFMQEPVESDEEKTERIAELERQLAEVMNDFQGTARDLQEARSYISQIKEVTVKAPTVESSDRIPDAPSQPHGQNDQITPVEDPWAES